MNNYSNYLDLLTINRLHNSTLAKLIRSQFTYEELMTTPMRLHKSKKYPEGKWVGNNPREILTTSSHKFEMKNGKKITTKGVYLSPANEVSFQLPMFQFTMCSNSGLCAGACINTAGQMVYNQNKQARINKTLAFKGWPKRFCSQLLEEITDESRKALQRGEELHARNNGTSDELWERLIQMDLFKACTPGFTTFYDYTKFGIGRIKGLPDSYHITFSIDENPNSVKNALAYLKAGYSVAVVMHENEKMEVVDLPGVVDGDLSDHRPLDPPGSIVVLKAKGEAIKLPVGQFIKSAEFVRALNRAAFIVRAPCVV